MHDVVIVSIPLLAIFAGILMNRADVKELRAEMSRRFDAVDARFNAVDARFDRVDAEVRYFDGVTGKLEGHIESIEKRS